MAIPIKSPADIAAMRRAGTALWAILEDAVACCTPGTTTGDLAAHIEDRIRSGGAVPVLKGYRAGPDARPFPAAASISLNEEAVHGLPGDRIVRAGDIVSIDAALSLAGWHADAAIALIAGEGQAGPLHGLARVARRAVEEAASAMTAGRRWSEVAATAREQAANAGLDIVAEYAGHGIGRALHEPPACPLALTPGGRGDFTLLPGMVLTIEPILTLGPPGVVGLEDGFTVVTAARSPACHEERTVAVTRAGPVVLTAP